MGESAPKPHTSFLSGLIRAVSAGKGWHSAEIWGFTQPLTRLWEQQHKDRRSSSPSPTRTKVSLRFSPAPSPALCLALSSRDPSCTAKPQSGPAVPFFSAVGSPSCRSCGSMEWGNCSRGPVSRLTPYGALFPARAKSSSRNLENHLGQRWATGASAGGGTPLGSDRD